MKIGASGYGCKGYWKGIIRGSTVYTAKMHVTENWEGKKGGSMITSTFVYEISQFCRKSERSQLSTFSGLKSDGT